MRIKTDGGCPLGVRKRLSLFQGDADIVPEMYFALFHLDQSTQFGEETVDVASVEKLGITSVKIENEFRNHKGGRKAALGSSFRWDS